MIKRGLALLVLLCMALPCAGMAEQTEARRVVYLTFDDGPKKDTPELLETLSELDVPATFFLVGLSVRAFPEYAKQIVQAGYAVGSHTMAHSIGRIQRMRNLCCAIWRVLKRQCAKRWMRPFRPICSAFPAAARHISRASRRWCGTRATRGLTGTR